jgi:hypothetical protein
VSACRWDIGTHQATKRDHDEIVAAAVATRAGDPTREVVFYQDPAERRTTRGGSPPGRCR